MQDHPGDRLPAAADGHGHRQRAVRQLGVVVVGQGEPHDPPRSHVQHRGQVQLALVGDDLGAVAVPLLVHRAGREVAADQVRGPPPTPARAGGTPTLLAHPGHQMLLTHDLRDGLLADPPARLAQVIGDPR